MMLHFNAFYSFLLYYNLYSSELFRMLLWFGRCCFGFYFSTIDRVLRPHSTIRSPNQLHVWYILHWSCGSLHWCMVFVSIASDSVLIGICSKCILWIFKLFICWCLYCFIWVLSKWERIHYHYRKKGQQQHHLSIKAENEHTKMNLKHTVLISFILPLDSGLCEHISKKYVFFFSLRERKKTNGIEKKKQKPVSKSISK